MLLSLPVTLEAICETSDHETARCPRRLLETKLLAARVLAEGYWRRGCSPDGTLTMRLLAPAMSWPTVPRVSIASHNESGQLPKILGKNVTTKLMF